VALVHAANAWVEYQQKGRGYCRFVRAFSLAAIYHAVILSLCWLPSGGLQAPILRQPAAAWYTTVAWIAFPCFLFLTFWTIDAACLCRSFIQQISQGPTLYPLATREFFSSQRGRIPQHLLPEWIDVRIIADITQRVGTLIYLPSIALFLLLIAHHKSLYNWP
jgi:hypothetical protein